MNFGIDYVTGCSTNQVAARVDASLFLSTHLHANALLCGKFNMTLCVVGDISTNFIQLGVKTRLQDFYIVYKGKNGKSVPP
jgi:hypothetical protein